MRESLVCAAGYEYAADKASERVRRAQESAGRWEGMARACLDAGTDSLHAAR